MSNLPNFTRSFDYVPDSPEKSGCDVCDRSPLDLHFRQDGEGDPTSATQPRLQEIGSNKPRYFSANSIVSSVALITIPHTEPPVAVSFLVSTSPEPAAIPNGEQESMERPASGEIHHPPSAFDSTGLSTAGLRTSQASGLLSIITLPSFIVNDRPRTYSSSVGVQIESPVRPNNYHHKRPSIFGQRLSGTESISPISPANSEDTGGKGSWPTSSSLQIATSVLKRSGSVTSSVRSCSPSSHRSSRRSLGRLNLSPGSDDEAAIQWKRLPPLPPAQCTQSRTVSGVEEFSTERLPSHCENEPRPPILFAARVPLPPSPSTLASSVSSLTYTPPSPEDIPPINNFTTPYILYPPLPPSIPPSPRQFSYPPTSNPTDGSMGAHTVHRAGRTVSLPRLPSEVGETQLNLNAPTATTTPISALPRNNNGFLPYGLNEDAAIYRRSASAYSQHSSVQELVLPSPSLLGVRSSPPPPMSPRGPRPLPPTPGQLTRNVTLYSQTSSTGQ